MPLFARYLLVALVAALVAIFLSPVFPGPLNTIVYWGCWIAALIFVVLAAFAAFGRGRTTV